MSLQLILGGSGSGKTARLNRMAIEQARSHPDQNVFVLVPEQYTMQTQRSIAHMASGHCVMNMDILSFNRLAYRIFDEVGQTSVNLLGETGKSMIIRKILIEHAGELHAYRGNIRRAGFTNQVSSMLSELITYDISPEELDAHRADFAGDDMLYSRISDIAVLYKAFMQAIHERFMTAEEVPDLLCRVIRRSQMLKGACIYMDNFTGFTPVQYRLIGQLLRIADRVVITLPVDPAMHPYRSAQLSELFYLTKETIRRLNELCEENRIHRDEDILLKENHRSSQELAVLEKNIFRSWIQVYHEEPEHIRLYQTAGIDEEMRTVAETIHELVSKEHVRYREIAVVTADMEGCRRSAQYWMQRYDIPCFFDVRRAVSANMLPHFLLSLLDVMRRNFSYDAVFTYLKCGLSGFSREEADILENYVLAYGIRGWNRWNREWKYGADDLQSAGKDLAQINALRKRFVDSVKAFYTTVKKKDVTVLDMIRSLYLLMGSLKIEDKLTEAAGQMREEGRTSEAAEYEQIYDAVIDMFEKMAQVLGNEQMSIAELRDILQTAFESMSIGIIPPGLDQVTFGDIRRTRLDSIRVLFFTDLNDSKVPAPAAGGGLITDRERQIMSEKGLQLAPTDRETICTERYYLYSVMTKPSERLYLLYPMQDDAGKKQAPSSILKQIQRIYEKLKIETPPEAPSDTLRAGRRLIVGLRDAAARQQPDKTALSVYNWMTAQPSYRDFAHRAEDAAFYTYRDERLSPSTVEELYGKYLEGGVTMLEQYASCAFAHFLRYGLGLEERRVYEVKAPDLGTIYHRALEIFAKKVRAAGVSWRDITQQEREKMSDESVQEVVSTYNNAVMQGSSRYQYLTERVARIMRRTTWAIFEQLKKGSFEPSDFEMGFRGYAAGSHLRLSGRIDRMDLCPAGDGSLEYVRIIDYKSGKTDIDYTMLYGGMQMQLFVYMNAALEGERSRLREKQILRTPSPAGVFYYDIDDPIILSAADVMAAPQEADEEAILNELYLRGLAVDDRDSIYAMDAKPGEKPKVLPLSYNKDDTLSAYSHAVPIDDFYGITQFVEKKTASIGDDIFSGRVSAVPYRAGDRQACTYCRYHAVCGFDSRLKGYRYRRLKELDRKKFFELLKGGSTDDGD